MDQHIARALSLNPNDARVPIQAAIIKLLGGEAGEACKLASRAIELNPLRGDWYDIVGLYRFIMGQHESALDGSSYGDHKPIVRYVSSCRGTRRGSTYACTVRL